MVVECRRGLARIRALQASISSLAPPRASQLLRKLLPLLPSSFRQPELVLQEHPRRSPPQPGFPSPRCSPDGNEGPGVCDRPSRAAGGQTSVGGGWSHRSKQRRQLSQPALPSCVSSGRRTKELTRGLPQLATRTPGHRFKWSRFRLDAVSPRGRRILQNAPAAWPHDMFPMYL